MKAPLWLLVASIWASLAAGCLGTLAADPRAEQLALAPQAELDLPARESRRHWLLRSEPGWCGAHEIRYGGDPDDEAIAAVRTVLFHDIESAASAYSQLTPSYLYNMLRGRVLDVPQPFDYPEPLAGDAVFVSLYEVRLPLVNAPDATLIGQLTAVHAGHAVVLVESIGVPPERLVPAVRELVRAANRLATPEC